MGPGLNMPIRQVKARETINVIAFSRKKKQGKHGNKRQTCATINTVPKHIPLERVPAR
jgi:hypothetical protein